ncbi:MAG: heavy-metal-associated domain-containing protein [Rhodothermia bacterium]|nr:heavy-metal-associated domain-containing protein [Rhodothermia bacterium]
MKAQIQIEGMGCNHCIGAVREALGAHPEIAVTSVEIGKAIVTFDENQISQTIIQQAIDDAGYEVKRFDNIS